MIEIENYGIDADNYNVIVAKKRTSKDGNESWKQEAFFGSLYGAAKYILSRIEKEKVQECKQLTELIEAVQEAKNTVSDAVKSLKTE